MTDQTHIRVIRLLFPLLFAAANLVIVAASLVIVVPAVGDVAPIKPPAERRANAEAAVKAAEKAAAAQKAAEAAPPPEPETRPKEKSDDDRVTGSRVTIQGEMRLSDALSELEEQTENRLVDYRGRLDQDRTDPTLDLDLKDVSYWAAVEEILDQAELTLYAYTNIPNTLGLASRPPGLNTPPPVSTSDLFRVQVIRLSAHRDLRDSGAQSMVASLEVTWEPRVAPLVVHQAPDAVEATGDDGRTFTLIGEYGVGDARVQEGIGAVELELPFELPPRSVQRIATLEGTLRAQIPTEHKKFTFHDLENVKDVIKREESISVVLEKVNKNRELHEFRVLLRLEDAAEELKMQQGWIYGNAAYLIDPNGKRVEYAGLETFRSTPEEIGLSYKFEVKDGLKGYQFVYESPSNIATIPVKYKLEGIELP